MRSTTALALLVFTIALTIQLTYAAKKVSDPGKLTKEMAPLHQKKKALEIGKKIAGGKVAIPGQFPYQVSLHADGQSLCGGSLISNRWILTAAHCVDGANSIVVRMGTLTWKKRDDMLNSAKMTTSETVVHENWNTTGRLNDDIALVKLPSEVPLSNFINTITLANDDKEEYINLPSITSGWGKTAAGEDERSSPVLRWAKMTIIPNLECKKALGRSIIESNICTSGAGLKNGCKGDSGGPMTVGDGANKKLLGVASFIKTCATGLPTAFTRVPFYRDWIRQKTGI